MTNLPPIKEWPADNIRRRSIDELIPYARNSRTHSDAQVAQIAASMVEWGWTNPVLVDESGNVLAGHGRILAARQLGYEDVPTMVADGWTEAQKKAYVIADNKLAENAGWDTGMLSVELGELDTDGFDLSLIGFDEDALAGLLADKTEGLTDPDEVPEAPEEPATVLGDLWVLGNHRLLCGDSTSADDVEKVLNGVKPHLMVTDPPYGVDYSPEWRKALGQEGILERRSQGGAVGKVMNDDRADWADAWSLFPGDVVYAWSAPGALQNTAAAALERSGFEIRTQIIWAKSSFVIGRGHYHYQHEPCWYAVKKGKKGYWNGDRTQSTVWSINRPSKNETGHSTQKPVECMRRPIVNNSSVGQAVYEPFSGSGTTIIAAEMESRACYAIELNPAYVDVAIKRWQDFTGADAVMEATGQSYNEILNEGKDEQGKPSTNRRAA